MDVADIEERRVESPLTEYAQFRAELAAGIRDPGTTLVRVNMRTKIGGLVSIPAYNPRTGKGKRRLHHELAAEEFLNLYEAGFGSVSPAVDPEKTPVDTSLSSNHDGSMVHLMDTLKTMREAETKLGKEDFNRIVATVCLCVPLEESAPLMPSGKPNWRHVEREAESLLFALDRLAVLWGMASEESAA